MLYLLCFIPPLAVLCCDFKPRTFKSWASLIVNIILTFFGYVPGVIHAFFVVRRAKADNRAMENQDVSAVPANAGDTELASLDVTDIEIFLLGTMALWGDSKVTQKEMDFLLEKTQENIKDLKLFAFTDPADVELSCKEYLIELFSLIKKQEQNADAYADIEIPEKSIKKLQKKNKKFEPTVKQRIIFMLLGVLEESYEADYAAFEKLSEDDKKKVKEVSPGYARLSALQDDMKTLAEVDGEFSDEERALLEIINLKTSSAKGCWIAIWIMITLGFLIWRLFVWSDSAVSR